MALRQVLNTFMKKCVHTCFEKNLCHTRCLSSSTTFFKYDQNTIDAVIRWNKENDEIYGPLLKSVKKSSVTSPSAEPPKERGRPKKIKTAEPENNQPSTVPKRTSKKLKNATTTTEILSYSESTTQTEPFQDTYALPNNAEQVNQNQISNPELNINGIPLFPLFPPERTEFYVNPPEVPNIYIPGHTERSSFENPFYPSVGTILSATQPMESRVALKRWKDKLVEELGEEGFKKHKKEIIDRGIQFHTSVQQHLEGVPRSEITVSPQNEGYWSSAEKALSEVNDIKSIEKMVMHRDLCYKGQYDCVAYYRDQLVLIDWKTSKKTKADIRYTYDNPLQVAAYVGACNFMTGNDMMIDKALIVVCYEDGQPAHTHLLSRTMLVDYWAQWLRRLHQYWAEKLQGS